MEERGASQLASKFTEITEHLQAEILRAQHEYQEQAARKRKPAPVFKIGDQVWFNAQNLTTQRTSCKLDHRRIGPYKITKVVSPYSYEIGFLSTAKHHRVQPVSLLDPADSNPLAGQHNPPPPPVIVDGAEEHYVWEVLYARIFRRRLQYLVKFIWDDQSEWKAAGEVNELEAVDKFHERYPDKPRPLPEDN